MPLGRHLRWALLACVTLWNFADSVAESDSPTELQQGLQWSDAASLEWESERPHAARDTWKKVEALCAQWEKNDFADFLRDDVARASALCALASAELTAMENFPLPWAPRDAARENFETLQKIGLPENERVLATGQILARLSPWRGENLTDALTLFKILEGNAPDTPGVSYWAGYTLYRMGKLDPAQIAFTAASGNGDPRAALRLKRQRLGIVRDPTFGFSAYPFFTPARGLGVGALLWDDRIGDTPRSYLLEAQASHRGNLIAAVGYSESGILDPATVDIRFKLGTRKRDYYGGGMLRNTEESFTESGSDAELSLRSARYGWFQGFVSGIHRSASASGLPAFLKVASVSGFAYGLEWDGTDRPVSPQTGYKVSLRQEWLSAGAELFTRAEFQARGYWRLGGKHRVSVATAVGASSDAAPLNAECELASLGMPGVAEFRYQNIRCTAAWASYRYQVKNWFGVGFYGAFGGVAGGFSKIPDAAQLGAGVEAEFVFARNPVLAPRWEMGVFNGEWVIQGGLRTLL